MKNFNESWFHIKTKALEKCSLPSNPNSGTGTTLFTVRIKMLNSLHINKSYVLGLNIY